MSKYNKTEDFGHGDSDAAGRIEEKSFVNFVREFAKQQGRAVTFQQKESSEAFSEIPSGETLFASPESLKQATIFDLCREDRKRVQNLIEEFTNLQDTLSELQEKFHVVKSKEKIYKAKSSNLMKRVDVLAEKCQRLEGEKELLKEKHLESLTTLGEAVTDISNRFEISANEIHTLRKKNTELVSDNRNLVCRMVALENQLMEERKELLTQKLLSQKKPKSKDRKLRSKDKHPTKTLEEETKLMTTTTATEDALLQELFFRF